MDPVQRYEELLAAMDQRFRALRVAHPGEIVCGSGCAACCHGLFDVSLPDALRMTRGYAALTPLRRAAVAERAARLQGEIVKRLPELSPPYWLHSSDPDVQARIDALTEAMPEVCCPFLDDDDHCLVYGDRPLACRLEGLPMVDARDGLFDDWCEKNFRGFHGGAGRFASTLPSESMEELRLDYYAMQEIEQTATLHLAKRIFATRNNHRDDLTILIPSVVEGAGAFQLKNLKGTCKTTLDFASTS